MSRWGGPRSGALIRLLLATLVLAYLPAVAAAAEIGVAYLRATIPRQTLSLIQTPADNDGLAGAQLAIDDNNTTGKFLDQQFSLTDTRLAKSAVKAGPIQM